MLSKRKRVYEPGEVEPEDRLLENIRYLFGTNKISGNDGGQLVADARASGAHGLDTMPCRGVEESKDGVQKNQNRNLKRCLLKGSLWPKLYWAEIRVWNRYKYKEEKAWVAMALPHEILFQLVKFGNLTILQDKAGCDDVTRRQCKRIEDSIGQTIIGIGLWMDGVPCQWDRDVSVEVMTMNLPGIGHESKHRQLRIPVVGLLKHQMTTNTWHDIFAVVQWSFAHMCTGMFPTSRHDSTPFRKSDAARAKVSGTALNYHAGLVQIRADWCAWKGIFRFPGWQDKQGCCWRCNITPDKARGWTQNLPGTHPPRLLGRSVFVAPPHTTSHPEGGDLGPKGGFSVAPRGVHRSRGECCVANDTENRLAGGT